MRDEEWLKLLVASFGDPCRLVRQVNEFSG